MMLLRLLKKLWLMMIVNNVLNVNYSEKEEIISEPVDMTIEFLCKGEDFL